MSTLLTKRLQFLHLFACGRTVRWAIIGERKGCRPRCPVFALPQIQISCLLGTSSQRSVEPNQDHRGSEDATSSIDQEEVDKFARLAQSWWDKSGEFKALHNMNELRVPLIRDALQSGADGRKISPLKGVSILDVGCGGGILSEPLARLGADVTGLDASAENITMATRHAEQDSRLAGRVQYRCSTVEDLEGAARYDGVIASEILEHVANPENFVSACCNLVKPGGSLFITTLNKTWLSYYLGIVAAEKIFKIVPDGAHDWNKFISPETVTGWLSQNGLQVALLHGTTLNPVTLRWCWTRNTSINYALHAIKPPNR